MARWKKLGKTGPIDCFFPKKKCENEDFDQWEKKMIDHYGHRYAHCDVRMTSVLSLTAVAVARSPDFRAAFSLQGCAGLLPGLLQSSPAGQAMAPRG